MQVHTVSFDDFSCSDDYVLGVHSTLEDYQFAYLLNFFLRVNFKRCKNDIDLKIKTSEAYFPLYDYTDFNTDTNWFLVSNIYRSKIKEDNVGLFLENETRTYLIPEKKKVDYFLKLEGEFTQHKIDKIIEVINEIPQVITSYNIDTNTLKSKEFLIF